ncbi:MAG TPA: CsbD family protein [Burkholderiaceae bacterium]|nr:CsbD family protein [Burkholderiaceae bacterium]
MNKDQVKGVIKEATGKAQQKIGQIMGSSEQEAKGLAKKVEGKVQQKIGDAKEKVSDAKENLKNVGDGT